MRRLSLILATILLSLNCSFANNYTQNEQNFIQKKKGRPTVGVVLCGGGAKGAAHIGVLKVLEEANVPIDIIVGTSMGALVGGIYSMGYSADQLDSLISNCDWTYLLSNNSVRRDESFYNKINASKYLISIPFRNLKSNKATKSDNPTNVPVLPAGFINGQNVLNLLTGLAVGYQDSLVFNKLPIPFACVATNLVTGDAYVMKEGFVPLSMRASMAIPGVFDPVHINGNVLVDGGVVNNFPVNIAKDLGADIVIGIDVQGNLATANELQSINQVLNQIVGLMGNDRYLENVKLTNIYIKPDVSKFTTFSFDKPSIDSLIHNGYVAAKEKYSELLDLSKRLYKDGASEHIYKAPIATSINQDVFDISDIIFRGVKLKDVEWLKKISGLKERRILTGDEINRAISIFMGTRAFSSVSYRLAKSSDSDKQDLILDFVMGPSNVFGVGFRFDTEEMASILVHLGINEYNLKGSKYWITGRLSYNPYAIAGYSYTPVKFPKIETSYKFSDIDMNIYQNKNNKNYLEFYSHKFETSLGNRYFRNFNIKAGIRYQIYDYKQAFYTTPDNNAAQDFQLQTRGYLSYFATALMDNRDAQYFPTHGLKFDVESEFFQTNFHKDFRQFGTIKIEIQGSIPLNDRFNLLPAFYNRVIIGNSNEAPYLNFLGGTEPGRYLPQQIPFIGINHANYFENSVGVARLDFRTRIGKKHYIFAQTNYARTSMNLGDIFGRNSKDYWGIGARYSYNSAFGPLSFNIFWSDYNHKVGAYVNLGYYF